MLCSKCIQRTVMIAVWLQARCFVRNRSFHFKSSCVNIKYGPKGSLPGSHGLI